MDTRTDSSTTFLVIAVLLGLTFVLVSCAPSSPAGNDHKPKLHSNGTAICPIGWIPAAASTYDVTRQKLCVRVKEQLLTWQKARQDCRASRGFLIKLDSALRVDNVPLDEYLKKRGLDTVWTGMHHEYGTLMWDDLQPHMVKAYYGKAQTSGWKRRGWKFDSDSFKLKANTCGVFEVHDDDSGEISDVQAAKRPRRSPQRRLDNPGVGSLRTRSHKRRRTGLDNKEVFPSRSTTEDKKLDVFQSFLSRRIQDGLSVNAGDVPNTGVANTAGKVRTSRGAQNSPGKTTAQVNIEGIDGSLVSTKRRTHRSQTTDPVTSATTSSGKSSISWKNTTQANSKRSSQTTQIPRSTTSVDDLLKHLLKASSGSSHTSDIGGSVDGSSNLDRLDPTLARKNDSVVRSALAQLTHSQSGIKDILDDMISSNSSPSKGPNIDLTDTSDPQVPTTQHKSPITDLTDTSDPNSLASHNTGLGIDPTDTSDPNSPAIQNNGPNIDPTDTSDPNSPVLQNKGPIIDLTDTSDPVLPASQNKGPIIDLTDTSDPVLPATQNKGPIIDPTDTSDPVLPATQNKGPIIDLTDTSDPVLPASQNKGQITDLTDTSDPNSPVMQNKGSTIDLTDTSDPISPGTNNKGIITDLTDTSDRHYPATNNNVKSATSLPKSSAVQKLVTPMITTTNPTMPATNNKFSTKSTMTTQFPATSSNASLSKESQDMKSQSSDFNLKVSRKRSKNFMPFKQPTTTPLIPAMKTRLYTSTGISTTATTARIPTIATSAKTTTSTATSTTATIPFTANQNPISSSSISSKEKLSSTQPTTKDIPVTKTTEISLTSSPISSKEKLSSTQPTTKDIPVTKTTEMPLTSSPISSKEKLSSTQPTTKDISVTNTTEMPFTSSAKSNTDQDVTKMKQQNTTSFKNPDIEELSKRSTANLPVMTTTDLPSSTLATLILSTEPTDKVLDTRTSALNNSESLIGKELHTRSAMTQAPLMIKPKSPMSIGQTTLTVHKDRVTKASLPDDFESSSNKTRFNTSTTTSSSIMAATEPQMLTIASAAVGVVAATRTTTPLTTLTRQKDHVTKASITDDFGTSSSKTAFNVSTTTSSSIMAVTELQMLSLASTEEAAKTTTTTTATAPLTTLTVKKDRVIQASLPDDSESSSSKPVFKLSTVRSISIMAAKDPEMSPLATATTSTTTTTTNSPLTAKEDIIIPKSAPFLSEAAIKISKRSTTNIPVMTTTDLPTSTVATTTTTATAATIFHTPASLTTSSVVTTQGEVMNSTSMNTPHTWPSAVASDAQATTATPVFIFNAENTTVAAFTTTTSATTTKSATQIDNTTNNTPVSPLQLTENGTPTANKATTTNAPSINASLTNNSVSSFDLNAPGADDSSEVTGHANSPQNNSTTTAIPVNKTTQESTDQSSKEVDLDPASNSSHNTGSGDLDVNHISNTTGHNNSISSGLDLSSPTNSEASDKAGSTLNIINESMGNVSANGDKAGSTKVDSTKDNKHSSQRDAAASRDTSEKAGGSSLSTDEPARDSPVPSNTVTLDQCEEEHASICVTEAVEELSLVGHCDRNWYGHRLLDRCYKPVDFMLKALEARQNCLRYSASLATVDTGFYGNITALLLSYFVPGSKVWVDASLNLDVPDDGQCAALEDGQLHTVDCNLRLPFICQKDVRFFAPYLEDGMDSKRPMIYVQNLTSFQPQTLWCPLRMSAFDDVILWFKDARPIDNTDDDSDATAFRPANGHMPNRLDIELSILEHLGDGGARIPKPAMLQGLYWCEIFRREPFNRVVSHKIFLKFTDVITLYGHITTQPVNYVTAAIFNRMGHVIGLPAVMERRLATLNKNITHFLRGAFPVVRDIMSFIPRTNPDTGRSEFTTYICLATGDLSSRIRGSLVDLYISAFYNVLFLIEDELQKEWNLTLPIRHAVAITMADMCPEANLFDRSTGLSATFPSTTVNNPALSRDMCNGVPIGHAFCKGDMQSGAYWDVWTVTKCSSFIDQILPIKPGTLGTTSTLGTHKLGETKGNRGGLGHEKPPKPDLVELNRVAVSKDNLVDVSDRLADVVNQAGDLSAGDIETIAQVVHRIVSLDKLTSEISNKLVTTANLVLDASEGELRKAEQTSNAPSRLLADLETFGEKAEIGVQSWVRYVTPNVAMEMWDLQDSSDVVIGFGSKQAFSWAAPLSEPRIQTIKDRMWAEQHLSTFDVAIQLPESLVKNTVQYSDSSLRLTMFIYRKTGLFVGSRGPNKGQGSVNSAIISASLGGRRISGLEDKVRLVFKPFQEPRNGQQNTQCVFWDSGSAMWSSAGCVYNGTVNGRTVCLCDHLTNFAILTDFYGDRNPISKSHETALTVLTIIGLLLSIIGLAITIITFLAFKKLRQGRAQQTLFNMSIALLCFQLTFLVGVKQTSVMPVCLAISVLLHYFILVSFAWMLIEAVLQYLTFVKVLGTYISRYTLKTVLPAWGLPLIPVIAVLATDYRLYLGRAHYCWMDLQAYYYAFALPIGIIIVFNLIMFSIIMLSLATKPKGLRSNQTNNSTRKTSLKAAITIFLLLGLTWIFGYLAIEDARLPFQYAFTIFSSLQGFLIFMLMVARRKQVRDQWEIMCCLRWKRGQNRQKKLSPTFSNSTSCSSSHNHSSPSFATDSITLSSSTGSRRSLHV